MIRTLIDVEAADSISPSSMDFSRGSSSRLNLRKRDCHSRLEKVNLSSYNSAFLCGLFADVAKVTQTVNVLDTPVENTLGGTHQVPKVDDDESEHDDPRLNVGNSVKRRRVSISKSSLNRRGSYTNLGDMLFTGCDAFDQGDTTVQNGSSQTKNILRRMDSLEFQLKCVSSKSDICSSSPKSAKSAPRIVFPNLPATVSESSCSQDLTRESGRHVSDPENNTKESYGWFVEMDGTECRNYNTYDVSSYSRTNSDLAFSAPTAPTGKNHDREVEWAKAADTVDDVLGDFF